MCMKKLSLLFVLGIGTTLLSGCGNSYKSISEEQFNAYFSSEKVEVAKTKFNEIKCFYFELQQLTTEMDYDLSRYIDTDYYYQYAKAVMDNKEAESHDLYIGSSVINDCKWYMVNADDGSKLKTGEEAYNQFNEEIGYERRTIIRQMEDPTYILSEYFENITEKQYYQSGKSLKIKVAAQNKDNYGYVVFNKDSLLMTSLELNKKVEEESGSIKYKYVYGKSFKHKTPEDIGYKEETK